MYTGVGASLRWWPPLGLPFGAITPPIAPILLKLVKYSVDSSSLLA